MVDSKYRDDGRGRFWDGTPEEEQAYLDWFIPHSVQENLDTLWSCATKYQESFISGAAIGLLTIGVIQSKPKSLAIMAWINSIWNNHYYVQKPLVDENYTGYDFSVCGPMPYSIPELSAEVLG